MIRLLNKISNFIFPKLDIKKLEFESFIDLLHSSQSNVSIGEIDAIYNIYSSPICLDNYAKILNELDQLKTKNAYKIEMGDFIGVYFIKMKNSNDTLLIQKYTPNFEREIYFYETNKIPTFSIRKELQYKDRFYYSIMNKNEPSLYLSDKLLKKYNIKNYG